MSELKDITGQKFGSLTILKYLGSSTQGSMWSAECSCGIKIDVSRKKLKKGKKSCGCLEAKPKWQNLLSRVKKGNKKSYVYLAFYQSASRGKFCTKIGFCSNPSNRIKQLSYEYSGFFTIEILIETVMASTLERALHLIFEGRRVQILGRDGTESQEFFDIHPYEALQYIAELGAEVSYGETSYD